MTDLHHETVTDDDTASPSTPVWVEAAPFRCHARHLLESTGAPWQLLAEVAQVRPSVLQTLLHGRHGRLRAQVPAVVAARLLRVSAPRLRREAPAYLARVEAGLASAGRWAA